MEETFHYVEDSRSYDRPKYLCSRKSRSFKHPQPRSVPQHDIAAQLLVYHSDQGTEYEDSPQIVAFNDGAGRPTSGNHASFSPQAVLDTGSVLSGPLAATSTPAEVNHINSFKHQADYLGSSEVQSEQLAFRTALVENCHALDDACDSCSDTSSTSVSNQIRTDLRAHLRRMRVHLDLADRLWEELQQPFKVTTTSGTITLEPRSMMISVAKLPISKVRKQLSEQDMEGLASSARQSLSRDAAPAGTSAP